MELQATSTLEMSCQSDMGPTVHFLATWGADLGQGASMGGQGHPSRHKPAPLCVPHHSLTDTFSSLRARLLLILHLQTFLRTLPQPRALARRACCPLSTNLHPPWDDGCPGCPHAQAPGGTPQVLLASLYLCSQHCTEGQQVSATTHRPVCTPFASSFTKRQQGHSSTSDWPRGPCHGLPGNGGV